MSIKEKNSSLKKVHVRKKRDFGRYKLSHLLSKKNKILEEKYMKETERDKGTGARNSRRKRRRMSIREGRKKRRRNSKSLAGERREN